MAEPQEVVGMAFRGAWGQPHGLPDVQRHSLRAGRRPPVVFTTELSLLQRRLLRLLGMTNVYDA
ncbi:MAG: hypothetical protein WBQ11_09975 [Isosphaeraceae bacterium]